MFQIFFITINTFIGITISCRSNQSNTPAKFKILIHCCKITFYIDWAFPVRRKLGKVKLTGMESHKKFFIKFPSKTGRSHVDVGGRNE